VNTTHKDAVPLMPPPKRKKKGPLRRRRGLPVRACALLLVFPLQIFQSFADAGYDLEAAFIAHRHNLFGMFGEAARESVQWHG
jgi:hypothetical protein